jgi:hypothetical protein
VTLTQKFVTTAILTALLGVFHLVALRDVLAYPLVLITVLGIAVSGFFASRSEGQQKVVWILLLTFFLGFSPPAYYAVTGEVIEKLDLPIHTGNVIAIEKFLFSGFFDEGHISLSLDTGSLMNPPTFLSRLVVEAMQLMYFSYYIWVFTFIGMGSVNYYKAYKHGRDLDKAYKSLMRIVCASIMAFTVNFAFYLIVPVVGPEYMLADRYINGLDGLLFAQPIHCFPSGHTALTWITAIMALKFMPRYGWWTFFSAFMITAATIFLRYHYITDLLGAIPLVLFAVWWGERGKLERGFSS